MLEDIAAYLYHAQHTPIYVFMVYYIGIYPIFGSVMWTTTSIFYYLRKEKDLPPFDENDKDLPRVTVLIAAHNEAAHIRDTLDSMCALNYPNYEVVVINDGSRDETLAILEEYMHSHGVRVITKKQNQGKAIALNDALMCTTGEILLCTDADADIEPDALRYMIPHFTNARLAAVAGNPRVKNAENFLCRLQALEYSTIIGMIRRSQRVWGRIMTFSGAIFCVRKNCVFRVGMFDTRAPTEDIDLTWKLQKNFFDVFFEPRAVCWIETPSTYVSFIAQRLRWAKGLMYVIHANFSLLFDYRRRRMWPVIIETLLSQLWVTCAVLMFGLWALSYMTKYPMGLSIVPMTWGMCIAVASVVSQFFSIMIDRKYDPKLLGYFFYSVYFSIYYWIFLTLIAFVEMPRLIFPPKPTLGWNSARKR